MTVSNFILVLATLSTALIAGLFYSYSCSVNPGLGKLGDKEYLAAMQSINRAILNPLFFMTFMGTLILLPVSTWLNSNTGSPITFVLLLVATLLYAGGVFGVTMLGNVPLNNALDIFVLESASVEEISRKRSDFEIPWNRLHTIRTVANIISLLLVILAICFRNNSSVLTK